MSNITIRPARREDVARIVELLADDPLGATREQFADPLPETYYHAFEAIAEDANHRLVVLEVDGRIQGTLQLSIIPYLTYRGGRRALVEAVRISRQGRGQGLGALLVEWAIDQARSEGCHVVQLTTDRQRPEALAFYQRLGFEATHHGLKLHLSPT